MASQQLKSEVTGSVWQISAQEGQRLEPGDTVMILESMKMEIPVLCEDGGTVVEILVEPGEAVSEGQALVVVNL